MKRKSLKYTPREGRVKTTLWLDREVSNAVATEAGERRVSKQSIMENSLKERYSDAEQLHRDALIADRLNKLERTLRRIEQQNEISAEAQALFVRMWLASTPEIPEKERDSAVAQAQVRYHRYLEKLAQNVRKSFDVGDDKQLKSEDFDKI